ncbi:MAG TPA: zinc/iron-chelating domain-containing protein [Verrucomicrobiales bacterium]|nr:zinc/iron-chelating domain-containing protein [Verrucomicrobiales bacterium]
MPVFYECQRCTACCRWPGQVRLAEGEIARLAGHLGVSEHEFIQQHTRLTDDRRGLCLNDKANGECTFLEGDDCSVQPVKPQQCRDFPNLWNFPGFRESCRALPKLVSNREFVERAAAATGRPIWEIRVPGKDDAA